MSLRIFLSGANGYMGKVIANMAKEDDNVSIVGGFDVNTDKYDEFPIFSELNNININQDVIIDFSHPSAFEKISTYALNSNTPIVFATTGLSEKQINTMKNLSEKIPVFFSANMSLGINLIINLAKQLTKNVYDKFDIEILEKHHNRKKDSPSGTALKIADAISSVLPEKYEYTYNRHDRNKKRDKNEIGISAIRGGTIVGEHEIIFAGHDEIIELKHTAMSREVFASGSLKAAKFIYTQKPGLYGMDEMFDSI